MRIISIASDFEEYESENELILADQTLLKKAHEIRESAYAPYSKFLVGAAVLMENDKIVVGTNQENIAYPTGLCAERVAVFSASTLFPNIRMKTIAITARSLNFKVNKPVAPCGPCRQAMAEYEIKQKFPLRVIFQGETGKVIISKNISSLLPFLFDEDGLKI